MLRFVCLMAAMFAASPVFAQGGMGDIFAWNACKQARATCHAVPTPDSTAAAQALGRCAAALGTVPDEYKSDFQRRYDQIKAGMDPASRDHGRGDAYKAMADGAYSVIAARVASGNWVGVKDAADACAKNYYKATGYLNSANQGYGQIEGAANDLRDEIVQFVSMLEAFEDFYGPIP